jgi:RNA polymerase sigma factor (sigma-70 family)
MEDTDLLREYVNRNSEPAFRELVNRHMGLVYSTALRQVRNSHMAEDVAQAVFIALAQKANQLTHTTVLEGWLFRATRFAAAKAIRSEYRHQHWIQEAARMEPSIRDSENEGAWEQIVPLLNETIGQLREKDRNVLLLRFFKGKTFSEVGQRMGTSEDAAKKRVIRALEHLRMLLSRRGVVLPAAILTATLSVNAAQAAPIGLSASIAAVAAAKGVTATTSTLTLAKGILKLMTWTKTKTAVLSAVVLVIGTGGSIVAYHTIHHKSRTTGESFFAGGAGRGPAANSTNALTPAMKGQIAAKGQMEEQLRTMGAIKNAVMPAFQKYADANFGSLPTNLDDLKPYTSQLSASGLDGWQIVATGQLNTLDPNQPLLQKSITGQPGTPTNLILTAAGKLKYNAAKPVAQDKF